MHLCQDFRRFGQFLLLAAAFALSGGTSAAQLNENCVVSVLNRTVQVKPDGTWVLPNIPANFGPVRARATCVENGVTQSGQSDFFTVPANGSVDVPPIVLGPVTPIPTQVTVAAPGSTLNQAGQTVQLAVTGRYADGSTKDLANRSTGTQYLISNPSLATVSADGLVTARQSGTVIVQAINEGTQGLLRISVVLSRDTDGDGIPDDVELREGLDPNNPADARDDLDRDGLTNRDELALGTGIRNPDSDGDGILDGEEVIPGRDGFVTNPLLADTDGDGIPDNVEIASGSDPTNAASVNLAGALSRIRVSPSTFVINVNTVDFVAFQQLTVTGDFKLGGTINLTASARGTNYTSSNLAVCNFGAENGRVYGGSDGTCTITVTNSGFSATACGVVRTFTPIALSYVSIPGFANNVDVNGNYAYVAAGATGLQVVDVTSRSNPHVVAALDTPGNANDVVVVGNYAYVADGSFGLQIINIANPLAPVLTGSLDTSGTAWDLVVRGGHAFVADGSAGLKIIDVNNPASPSLVGSLALAGTAKGVDVDLASNLAVVGGTAGVQAIDIANLAAPVLRGTAAGGDVRDLVIAGDYAFVADYARSFTVVDIADPAAPTVRASTDPSLGGLLRDVALSGNLALGADVYFANAVPIIDIGFPESPQPRFILNFAQYRDDTGTGIAVDGSFVYLTAHSGFSDIENGTIGDTRLYIGQHRAQEDRAGVAPTMSISSPLNGDTVIQGQQLPVSVQANDDVAVAAVSLLVDGVVTFTDTSTPYEFAFAVPSNATLVTLGAQAIDLGGNVGNAQPVVITAIPDPLTTLRGRIIRQDTSAAVPGASVTCLDRAATSAADGSFVIADVPTIQGAIVCRGLIVENGRTLRGFSQPKTPVPAGLTAFGDITIRAGSRVLLLPDVLAPSTTALVDALTTAGNEVVVGPAPEFTWDGTNPPLAGFACVVHLDGETWSQPLPPTAQQALADFVKGGGGYITEQWMGYERTQNISRGMDDLILFGWGGADGGENCGECTTSYVKVGSEAGHPVLEGIAETFSFLADGNSAGSLFPFAGAQPEVLMTQAGSGRPAVVVRQVAAGRAVQFSHAANYTYSSRQTLFDANVQKLYVNAIAWACK